MIIPELPNFSSARGSPMGRQPVFSDSPDTVINLEVHPLKMVDDCYDEGGAYWGMPGRHGSMYRATGYGPLGINDFFVRAKGKEAAQEAALTVFPNATFTTEE